MSFSPIKINSLHSRHYGETCRPNEMDLAGPSLRQSAWPAQKYRSGGESLATLADLTGSRIEPRPSAPLAYL